MRGFWLRVQQAQNGLVYVITSMWGLSGHAFRNRSEASSTHRCSCLKKAELDLKAFSDLSQKTHVFSWQKT
jgi:hypothetical protein